MPAMKSLKIFITLTLFRDGVYPYQASLLLGRCNLLFQKSILYKNKHANMRHPIYFHNHIFFTAKITTLTDLFGELALFALPRT